MLETLQGLWRGMIDFKAAIAGGLAFYLAAITVYLVSSLLWGARWYIILSRLGSRVSFKSIYSAVMAGILFNNITPTLKVGGEGFRVAWLRLTDGVPTDRSILSIIYERVTEVPGIALVASIAIFSGFSAYLGLGGVGLVVPLLLASTWIRWRLGEARERIRGDVSKLLRDWRLTFQSVALGVLVWLLDMLRFYLISLAVGVHLSPGAVALLSLSHLLLSFAPTPGGLGFVEAGLLGILIGLGVPWGSAWLIIVGERLISSVVSSIVGLAVVAAGGGIKLFKEASRLTREERGVGDAAGRFSL